jgi:hypothetical protein
MPNPVLTSAVPSDSPVGQSKKGVAERQVSLPFARSSKYHTEQGNSDTARVINTPAPGTVNYPIPSYGFLTGIFLTALATGGTGAAAVYFEDAPQSIILSIALFDVNGSPIWGPFTGYSAELCSKFGGYRLFPPDGSVAAFGPATATAIGNNPVNFKAVTGNFGFVLPIWEEFGRDGLGSLPNNDASARYNLQVQYASATASATGPVYTTAPTTYPVLNTQVEVQCRSVPPAADLFGNMNSIAPPAVGTTQYWSAQTAAPISGAQTLQLTRVGNLIRNHILVFRDTANSTRATAETTDMPPTLEFDWDSNIRYIANTSTYRQLSFLAYGFDVPFGVIALPYTTDPDTLAMREIGDEWMATVGATKLTLRFTPAASVGLTILTNDFVAASEEVYAAGMLAMGY